MNSANLEKAALGEQVWGWAERRATEELLWGVFAALNTLIPTQDTLKMQCGLKAPSRISGL